MNDEDIHQAYLSGKYTLYDAMGLFMHRGDPLPWWVVEAIETGFQERIEGRKTLDEVFGLNPTPGRQLDKTARRLLFAPHVYFEVKARQANNIPVDTAMFESIADDMRATFEQHQPGKSPPKATTIRDWYLAEKARRES